MPQPPTRVEIVKNGRSDPETRCDDVEGYVTCRLSEYSFGDKPRDDYREVIAETSRSDYKRQMYKARGCTWHI
ncbi:hypothetical protein L3Y34_012028 [Caenorhabditis briggsae]|uniref:Uncharacterized protein n=1 Tax=Caenorhabditis briggsae TaxID=6238 RepID=A0AAE8ZRD0_CAEBR|nr:hypothetical protein L3Y34_012028 [Caenorhabditis briggsae]